MIFPELKKAEKLNNSKEKRIFLGAYGFEDRTLGWVEYQKGVSGSRVLHKALMFKYLSGSDEARNSNKISDFVTVLENLGCSQENISEIGYNWERPQNIETEIENFFNEHIHLYDEIIVDISTMSKYLMLICLLKLSEFNKPIRIVYSEAKNYTPSLKDYCKSNKDMVFLAKYPSQGVAAIARARCLSSIRMQGQPITLITFTSFNEQLVRHLLGTMSPHRLIFINGRPPDRRFLWRERATQELHQKLIEAYSNYNKVGQDKLLLNVASTLDYRDTVVIINKIYNQVGNYERIICGATGSKMQTVGLFFSKLLHPDIHIEYPTPSSYYVKGLSVGVKCVHQILIPSMSSLRKNLYLNEMSNIFDISE